MLATRLRNARKELIIKLLRSVAGRASVKNVARDEEDVNFLRFNFAQQPIEKLRVFVVAFSTVKLTPNVPIGGMEKSHKRIMRGESQRGKLMMKFLLFGGWSHGDAFFFWPFVAVMTEHLVAKKAVFPLRTRADIVDDPALVVFVAGAGND